MFEASPLPLYKCMADLMRHLLAFYNTFGTSPYDKVAACIAARSFCILYTQLHATIGDPSLWVVKPKFHLFVELAEFGVDEVGDPSLFWTYQDEDYVGWLAKIAKSRGGRRSVATTPTGVIQKYRGLAA